jgi:hypothetical protein
MKLLVVFLVLLPYPWEHRKGWLVKTAPYIEHYCPILVEPWGCLDYPQLPIPPELRN